MSRKKIYILGGCAAALAAAAIILCLAVFTNTGSKYDKYFSEAQSAYLSGDWDTAIKALEKAVSAKPEEEAYLLLSEAYNVSGKKDMAIQVLYLGYSKTGSEAIALRLEELKDEKNGTSGGKTEAESIPIGSSSVDIDSTSLVLSDMGLHNGDISSIGMLSELESLSLSDNSLTDISSLSALDKLTFLQLSGNSIGDISPLRSLIRLKTLYIDGNPISDFTPLYALTSLKTLSMKNIEITESQLSELQEALPNCSIYSDKAVEEVVDITIGNKTFKSDVTELDLSGQSLTDISELAKCTHLTALQLHGCSLTDISALIDLQELVCLDISGNSVADLRPLMTLTSLTYLNADDNSITDVTALGYLSRLEELHLDGNDIDNFKALKELASLKILSLKNTGLKDDDLKHLSGISSLTSLNIEDNPELTANAAEDLKKALTGCSVSTSELLYTVKLGSNTFKSDAVSITALSDGISDLNGLEKFTQLSELILTNNYITSIEPLRELKSLESLDLYSNRISDITPLSGHSSLRVLDLERNSISDISALSGCTALRELSLGSNSIKDISALSSLTNLTVLALNNNSISDLTPLSSLTSLKALNLDSNSISDLTPLYSLDSLRTLYIRNNDISSSDLEQLQEALPDCNIICDEALGGLLSSNSLSAP